MPPGAALTEVSRTLICDTHDRIALQKILIVPERHKLQLVVDTRKASPEHAGDEAGTFAEFLLQ